MNNQQTHSCSAVCGQLLVLPVIFPSCFHVSEVSQYQKKTLIGVSFLLLLSFLNFTAVRAEGCEAQSRQHMVFMCSDVFSKKEDEGPLGGTDANFFPPYFKN